MANQNIVIDTVNRTLKLGNHVFTTMQQGDAITVTFPNDNTSYTMGTNNTVLVKKMMNADMAELTIGVIALSTDDAFLSVEAERDVPAVFSGSLQTNYTRDGVDGVEVLDLVGVSVKKKPDLTYNNVDGEDVVSYVLNVRSAKRLI